MDLHGGHLLHDYDTAASSPTTTIVSQNREDDICERCSSIPWKKLVLPLHRSGVKLPDTEYITHVTRRSACRICRLFAYALYVHDIEGHYISLRSSRKPSYPGTVIEAAELPRLLLVTDLDIDQAKLGLPGLYPSHVDFDLVKHWIRDCMSSHKDCIPAAPSQLQHLKVIDCRSRTVVPLPQGCAFFALSYVWGQTSATPDQEATSSLENAPPTIEDSIVVTLALDCQYIWIDRYCIDQTNDEEKNQQIGQMSAIYASAQLTLIAGAGKDPEYGLPGVQPASRKHHIRYESVHGVNLMVYPPHGLADIVHSQWSTRAWTFQEGYFSRRRLFFTDRQLVWICDQDRRYEAADQHDENPSWMTLADSLPDRCGQSTKIVLRSMNLLRAYCKRRLTYDTDALDAVIGALNKINQGKTESGHIWGVPTRATSRQGVEYVEIALNWYHMQPSRRRTGFPSWSVLGWEGQLHWCGNGPATIRDDEIASWNPMGPQTLASAMQRPPYYGVQTLETAFRIRLTGLVCPVSLVDGDRMGNPIAISVNNHFDILCHVHWDGIPPDPIGTEGLICLVIPTEDLDPGRGKAILPRLARLPLLVLAPERDVYRRIGLFRGLRSLDRWNSSLRSGEGNLCYGKEMEAVIANSGVDASSWWSEAFTKQTVIIE